MENSESEFFIRELIAIAPMLQSSFDVHCKDYDEVLPHVYMADVVRVVRSSLASQSNEQANRILDVLEQHVDSAIEEISNLIVVSFVQNIDPEDQDLELRRLLGPRLAFWLQEWEN